MAEHSGFFEALWDESLLNPETETYGDYDLKYLQKDFANYFSLFVKNGVFGNPTNQLKVKAGTGLSVIVSQGWAFINGNWYHNDSDLVLYLNSNTGVSSRVDSIRLRYSESDRKITAGVYPSNSELLRGDSTYDLKIADVTIKQGASSVSNSDIMDTRTNEDVCGLVTGLLEVQTTKDLFAQYAAIFTDWFNETKDQLTGDLAIRLQNEFDELNSSVATYEQNVVAYQQSVETIANNAYSTIETFVGNDFVIPERNLVFSNGTCTVTNSKVTASTLVDVYFTADTIQEAEDCQIYVDSIPGAIVLTAGKQPTAPIKALFRVRVR